MTDFIRENSSQLLHYMNLPCLTSGYFILSYFPQFNYVFYKFCNYLYCHFDLCHVSEFNDIIAYIALQKQPVLCGDTQRQKGTYFTAPFSVIIAFHSTFVNQSVFLIRVKFYISVFSSVYFLYNWRLNLFIPISVPRPSQTNIPLPASHQ